MSDEKLSELSGKVMQSILTRTRAYFESELGINVTETDSNAGHVDEITLLYMNAIIGLGGAVNMLIVFSFKESLLNTLYERMTDGLDIQPDEVEMYREEAAGEVVNTILGHCTIDLQKLDPRGAIAMTPPVILDRVKTIRRMKDAMFYTQSLDTAMGSMTISLVGPIKLFNKKLDYVS
jgi:CheY-specific phosphatase CheX